MDHDDTTAAYCLHKAEALTGRFYNSVCIPVLGVDSAQLHIYDLHRNAEEQYSGTSRNRQEN